MKEALRSYMESFDSFSSEEIEAIINETEFESFKKGEVILRADQICSKCYFILSGCLRQYQIVDGEEKTTAFFIEGQAAVLYDSYMQGRPSDYYLSCVEPSTLLTGTKAREEELHQKYPKLIYLIQTMMPHDFVKVQQRLSSMVSLNPEERYLRLMQEQPELLNRVPLYQLASYIGVTPESFSRIRKRIQAKEQKPAP